jgi:hypothetical protein
VRKATIVMTVLLLAPGVLGAEELELGLRTGFAWSDNVHGVADDEVINGEEVDPESDFSARITPLLSVDDPDGNLTWSLVYQPTYEAYLHTSDLDGLDHDVAGTVSWRFADSWSATLRQSYAVYQNSIRLNEAVGPGEEVTLGYQNQEIRANRTSVGLGHTLGPRDSISAGFSYTNFQYPDGDGIDRDIPTANLAYEHLWSERTKLGARFSWTRQVYQNPSGDDETDFYNLGATLDYRFSPTLRIEASAGPTIVDSSPVTEFEGAVTAIRFNTATTEEGLPVRVPFAVDATTCMPYDLDADPTTFQADLTFSDCGPSPTFILDRNDIDAIRGVTAVIPTVDENNALIDPSDTSTSDLTYFAHLALVKDWESWNGRIAYDRSNSENARFGSSSVADTLSGSLSWRPSRQWTLGLSAAVSLQEQVGDQVVPKGWVLANAPLPGVTLPDTTPGLPLEPCGGAGQPVCQVGQVRNLIASVESGSEEYLSQSISFTATRQLTSRSSAFASVYWYGAKQDSDVSGQDERWRHLVFWIGVDWKLDPIRF